MMDMSGRQGGVARSLSRLTVGLLAAGFICMLPTSCSDESNPVIPVGEESDCIDYKDFLHIAGVCDTPGSAIGVAVSGDYAYVADSGSGLQVIDISTARTPVIVVTVETPGYAMGVVVSEGCVYVADGYSGLQVAYRQCEHWEN